MVGLIPLFAVETLEPEMLEAVVPDINLVTTMMSLSAPCPWVGR